MFRFISHLDLIGVFLKAGRSAGIPFRYTKGFNPKPKFTLPFPLALGIESGYELGEVIVNEDMDAENFRSVYNERLPEDLKICRSMISTNKKSIASNNFYHDYEIKGGCNGLEEIASGLVGIQEMPSFGKTAEQHYSVSKTKVHLRLAGDKSIKNVFELNNMSFLDFNIKRIMIWEFKNFSLSSFF